MFLYVQTGAPIDRCDGVLRVNWQLALSDDEGIFAGSDGCGIDAVRFALVA